MEGVDLSGFFKSDYFRCGQCHRYCFTKKEKQADGAVHLLIACGFCKKIAHKELTSSPFDPTLPIQKMN